MLKKIAKYFLIFCVICGVASALMNPQGSAPSTPKATQPAEAPKQYTPVSANDMMQDLERNAAAAQKKYKGQNICVAGRIGVIDSNGDYLLIQSDNEFAVNGIVCNLKSHDKAQEEFLLNVQIGQHIKAYGVIKDVGEVIGYSMAVDAFSAQ